MAEKQIDPKQPGSTEEKSEPMARVTEKKSLRKSLKRMSLRKSLK